MKKSYGIFIVFLLLLISACSNQVAPEPVQTSWSEEDLTAFVSTMGQDVSSLIGQGAAGLKVLNAVPKNSPVQGLSVLSSISTLSSPEALLNDLSQLSFLQPLAGAADNRLPRGEYQYQEATGNWELKSNSDDLILIFSILNANFSKSTAKIVFNWDAKAPTIKVMSAGGSTEVPTDMTIFAKVDGVLVGNVTIAAGWYQSSCGYRTLEPESLKLSGKLNGNETDSLAFALNLSTQTSGNATTAHLDASVKLTVGEDFAKLSFDSKLNTTITRDSNCYLTDLKLNSGDLAAQLETKIQGEEHSLGIKFGFDNPVLDNSTGAYSLDILNGLVTADGQTVVSFSGKLDDSNANGIPGENILIQFDDGSSTSLEALLASL